MSGRRKAQPTSVNALGASRPMWHRHTTFAPVSRSGPTIAAVCPTARPIVFGHVNEGNLHVNVLDTGDQAEEVTDAVLRLVASLHGSISSEHGVGRAKVAWLQLSRSATEIAAMQAVKRAFDPAGTLSPGVLLP